MNFLLYLDDNLETQAVEYLEEESDFEEVIIMQVECDETDLDFYLDLCQSAADAMAVKLATFKTKDGKTN